MSVPKIEGNISWKTEVFTKVEIIVGNKHSM